LAKRAAGKARSWKELGKGAIGVKAQERARKALERAAWRQNQPND